MLSDKILAVVGLAITVIMMIAIPIMNRRKSSRFPFLVLVFCEVAFYFISLLTPPHMITTGLVLSICSMFYGIPALYLFALQALNETTDRIHVHFAPALINLPVGLAVAFWFTSGWMPGTFAMVYFFIAIAVQTFQVVVYGRMIFISCGHRGNSGIWLRRISQVVLFGYGFFALTNWLYFAQEALYDILGKPVSLIPGFETYFIAGFVLFIWTLSLAALWGYEYFALNPFGERYSGLPLDPERANTILAGADDVLSSLVSLDPDSINPRRLSEQLGVPYYLLSRSVNESRGKSVSDFIHGYRIRKAKELLVSQPGLTVLDIAYQSGFKSKSTFNAVFKEMVEMTPKEYRTRIGPKESPRS